MLDSGMGQDSKQRMWQGQDDGQKSCDCQKLCDCKEPCGCQKSMMCQDDKQEECGRHESMTGPDGKHIKSMMGDRDDNGSVKIVIVKFHV